MADKEEVQGEGHGLDEILREAAKGVLKKADAEKAALKKRIEELEGENKFLRGRSEERRFELRFAPKSRIQAGEEQVTAVQIGRDDSFPRYVVAVQSAGTPEMLEELRARLPDSVLLMGVPPGTEVSVLEVIPKTEE